MKKVLTLMLVGAVGTLILPSCSGNSTPDKAVADTTNRKNTPRMSAKERLIKNNIIERHNSWATMKLQGKVKRRTAKTYTPSKNGVLLLDATTVDSFDNRGNQVLQISYLANGKQESRDSGVYNEQNNVIAEYSCKNGKVSLSGIERYDSRGNNIESIWYYAPGKIRDSMAYQYDSDDNLIEVYFGTRNPFASRAKFKYNEEGLTIRGESYDSSGVLESTYIRKRDEKGNPLYTITYKADGSIERIDSMLYDDKGSKVVDASYNANGSLKDKWTYKYDDHGNEIERIEYKQDGSVDDKYSNYYTYEYDAAGNKTKQTTLALKAGVKQVTKTITWVYVYY